MKAPDEEIVAKIVAQVKSRNLDGIGITEHWDKEYAYNVKDIVEKSFNNEIIIIPGQEIDIEERQEVELYLPDGVIFRFLAHPGFPANSYKIGNIHGIEIGNFNHDWHIDKEKVTKLAEEHDLIKLRNSDAHSISHIGEYYNEIDLSDLSARAS